jgi:3-isopropylmalate dehydratase small subunit
MSKILSGSVFVVGDDVNTDEIIPARWCTTTDLDTLGPHALEDLHPSKSPSGLKFEPYHYDIIVAGENFGAGSSREVAPIALAKAGIKAVIAKSFARIFYRNAVNTGLPITRNYTLAAKAETGETLSVDVESEDFLGTMQPLHRAILRSGGLTAFNKSGQKIPHPSAPPRPMTIAEKILAKASDVDYVEPGMLVYATVDRVITHELTLPVAVEQFWQGYGRDAKPKNTDQILFVADHTIQIPLIRDDWQSQIMVEKASQYVKELGIQNAFLPPAPFTSQGICHVLFPELGLIQPDTLVAGTDSHTSTHGAFGAFAVGIGNTDLTEILASGRLLLDVPQTIRVNLEGRMPEGVYAKDVILYILSQVGMNGFTNCVVEFGGPALPHLSADDRSTISNMTVEGGATCGLWPVGRLRSDPGAEYRQTLSFDLSQLQPYVAVPYSPANGRPIDEVGEVPIDIAWVGSCTGGKLEDVAAAAEVVRGHKVAKGVQFIVAPATLNVMHEAGRRGYLRDIIEAGGHIAQSACGACIAMGPGTTQEGQVAVYSSNRNFKGRSGKGMVYLASPATVAASALAGRVADPRKFLQEQTVAA